MVHLTQERVDVADRSVVAISRPASTIAADATLVEALHVLLRAGSKHVVVVDPGSRFVGVFGGRHLVAAWAASPHAFATTPVSAVLDPTPPIVAPTATVGTAVRMIRDYGSDVIVIVDQNRVLVGVVTADDLLTDIADLRASG